MTPNISPPTDNIFKFACLFGLALVVSGIFGFISIYSSALDRKIKYSEVVIPLESKERRTMAEESMLALNKKLIEVTRSNEQFANLLVTAVLCAGVALSGYGAKNWYVKIQARDDVLALLQLEKLRAEITKLKAEAQAMGKEKASSTDTHVPL